jgi:hypothetical protein
VTDPPSRPSVALHFVTGCRHALVGEILSPPAPNNLQVPTTATFALDKLWVVNARFGVASPETADYWITRLPTSP